MSNAFYIQDTRCYVGNSMLWWKFNNCGYTTDPCEAKVFTREKADTICNISIGSFKMWPKDYVDEKVTHHVDMQDCDHAEAIESIPCCGSPDKDKCDQCQETGSANPTNH